MAQSHETPGTDRQPWQDPQKGCKHDNQDNLENGSGDMSRRVQSRLAARRVDQLKPHPSYERLGIRVPASKLNALIEQNEHAFLVPLVITSDGIIIDGYARWEVARLQNRPNLECIEYDFSEPEALHRLLLSHLPSPGLAPFNRIVLALGLEHHFRQRAWLHQQAGGKNKGSSKLTEAERLDVRKEVATAACVSVGTLTHVKQLLRTADPAILQALRDGEIRIDRAWRWSKEPRDVQRENLRSYRRDRGMDKAVERLVARQVRKLNPKRLPSHQRKVPSSIEAVGRLASVPAEVLESVNVIVVKAPGRIIALSDAVAREIGFGAETQPCR